MQAYSKDPVRMAALAAASLQPAALNALERAAGRVRLSWLGRTAAALIAGRKAKLAIDELRGWDDHMLRDIGLERMDIEGAVRGRFRPLPRGAETRGKPPRPHR
jgi:uncharacterized protein YjiS (DUF1127 family)